MNYQIMPGLKHRKEIVQKDRFIETVNVVCKYFGITFAEITKHTRYRKFCEPRFISFYFLHYTYGMEKSSIAKRFRYDHTTVLHGIKKCETLMRIEPDFKTNVTNIELLLTT